MYVIRDEACGPENLPGDARAFIDFLNTLEQSATVEARGIFEFDDILVTRAPGRLDVMGGIADYSGSRVLQLPIREATLVALQLLTRPTASPPSLKIVSLGSEGNNRSASFEMPISELTHKGGPLSYTAARAYFNRDKRTHWAAYVAGAFIVLQHEHPMAASGWRHGARVLVSSQVPEGKGVSSSAAIEVAAMHALSLACGVVLPPRELALLCQKVENLIVGAPCGVMDQMTSACGEANRLLALRCQPAELEGKIAIPDGFAVWGIDSGVRHSVSGADYGSVRVGAFMGYRMIAESAGLKAMQTESGTVQILDTRWNGYLANVTPEEFENELKNVLPEYIMGADFISKYGATSDPVTRVKPAQRYAVRTPTAHPIYENYRVKQFAAALANPGNLTALGNLMYQSHASYFACGLGSPGTDRLVNLVKEAGEKSGLFGAKITGGGSGGTVAIIGKRGARAAIEEVAEKYRCATGHKPYIFEGSSSGAVEFGHVRLQHTES